jgi:hypothetical protein
MSWRHFPSVDVAPRKRSCTFFSGFTYRKENIVWARTSINQSAWGCMQKSSPSKPMNGLTMQHVWYLCHPNIVPQTSWGGYSEAISAR